MDDRDDEAFVRRGRDPDVEVFLQHDLAAFVVHGRVQRGEFLQGTQDRFDEEREEGELEALPFRGLLQVVPQVDQLGHVHLFDVREMGRGHVGLRHLFEDPLAKAVDRNPLLPALRRSHGHSRRWGQGGRGLGRHRGRLRPLAHVVLRDPPLRAGPPERAQVHAQFLDEPLDDLAFVDALPDVGELELAGHRFPRFDTRRKTAIGLTFCTATRVPFGLEANHFMGTVQCPLGEEWGRGGVAQTGGRDLCPALRAGEIPVLLLLSLRGTWMRRPAGITVLGALVSLAALIMVLIGIASFFVGLAFLIPGTPISGTELVLNGILYFFIGVALGVAGGGLLMMRPWAWGVALIATLVTLAYLGYRVYERSNAGSGTTLTSLLTLGIVTIIFVYLLSASRAFRRSARSM